MSIGAKTGISWTDATWNVLAGCKECDPGCQNCYAKNVANKLAGNTNAKIRAKYLPVVENHKWTEEITITEKEIIRPLQITKSKMIFVNSMSDLFYEKVPDFWIDRHLVVMNLAKWHFFQVLTKRQTRLKKYFENLTSKRIINAVRWLILTFGLNEETACTSIPLLLENIAGMENVIWVVSASNQRGVDLRVPALLETPYIGKRGVSLEPLISEVEIGNYLYTRYEMSGLHHETNKLSWVILGGESSKLLSETPRLMKKEWAMKIIRQCEQSNTPLFFKQTGEVLAKELRLKAKKGDNSSEFPTKLQIQEFPEFEFGEYVNYFQKKRLSN